MTDTAPTPTALSTAPSGRTSRATPPSARARPGRLLALLLTGQFMALLDVSIVNVAAPTLRTDLHASGSGLQLVIAGYTIAYAVLLITGSRLGDLFGFAAMFRLGLAGFTLASLACGLAPTTGTLIGFRIVQGAAAALMVPQVISLIQRGFSGAARVRALGAYTSVLAFGMVAGQVIGGLLVGTGLFDGVLAGAQWRPAFLVNVPIGLALLLAVRRRLPAGGGDAARALDLPGLVLLAGAVFLVVLPLVLGHEEDWPLWGWLMLAAGTAAGAVFALVQRRVAARGGDPLIDPAVLRSAGLAPAGAAIFLLMMGVGGCFLALTLHLQSGLGDSALVSGLRLVPMAACFGLAGLYWRRLPERWHAALPVVALLVAAVGYLVLAGEVAGGQAAGAGVLVVTAVLGAAGGCSYGPLMAGALRHVPPRHAADASGVIVTLVQLGQVVGVATLGTLFLASVTRPGPAATGHALALVAGSIAVLSLVAAAVTLLSVRRRTVPAA